MRFYIRPQRLAAWLTTTSLCLSAIAPALGQTTPLGGEQAGNQGADPPALAGRLASLTGAVSFHAAGETQWNAATLNYPVTNGEAFWTEPQAGATLEIADDRLVMDDSTEIDITALDQNQLAATEAQGAVFLQLNSLAPGQEVSFNTPRGTVQIGAVGRYEIVAGDTNDATTITVVEGAAHITGSNLSLDVGPQQTATIGGTDVLQGNVGPMQQDAFLQAQLSVRPRQIGSSAPRQVRYMTGASDLEEYGSFRSSAQYGQIWYPNDVAGNWAPYRDGHWAYVQPWGWTWVDNARWGFAPFHYGRWVQVDNRWGWVAGGAEADYTTAYPVYSPALVSFVDVGGAALAGAALGFAAGELAGGYAPAWVPLGPREPYYPWYHCRSDYFGRVNTPYGVPRTIIERGPTYITRTDVRTINNTYINRGGATVAPAAAFVRGQGIRDVARPLPEGVLANARPVLGRLAVRPSAYTPNLSPAVAHRFNVALPRTPVQPMAAGPRVLPPRPGRAMPELRRASLPENVHATPAAQVQGRPSGTAPGGIGQRGPTPGVIRPDIGSPPHAGAAGPPIARPGMGLPSLRAPGARPQAVPPGGAQTLPRQDRLPAGHVAGAIVPRSENTRPGAALGRPTGQNPRIAEPRTGAVAMPDNSPQAKALPRTQQPAGFAEPRPTPQIQAARPVPRTETLRPAAAERSRATPRADTPRAAPRVEAPRPAPRIESPRPAAPRPEAPRPVARMEAPRAAPKSEAPRPAPRFEAPRPAVPPSRPAPAPAARPAPGPGKHEPPH